MKKIVVFLITIVCTLGVHANISIKEAVSIAEKFERDTTDEIMVANQFYNMGDSVQIDGVESIICPFDSAWCVFIDYYPLHEWEHECAYVFVEVKDGQAKYIPHSRHPKLEKGLWTRYRVYRLPSDRRIHKSPMLERIEQMSNRTSSEQNSAEPKAQRINSRLTRTLDSHLYAVIINFAYCAEQNFERYWNDCSIMYSTLKNYGFDDEDIYVAIGDSNDETPDFRLNSGDLIPAPADLDGDGTDDIDYPATNTAINGLLAELIGRTTEEDIVVIYVNGAYNFTVGDENRDRCRSNYASCVFESSPIFDHSLANTISEIKAKALNIAIQREVGSNLAGCLIARFDEISSPRNYVITSGGEDGIRSTNDFVYSWYAFDFVSAANQLTPDGIAVSSDENSDGYITIEEIYHYMAEQRGPSIHYYQNPNPVCLAQNLTLNEVVDNSDCLFSDLYIRDNTQDFGVEPNVSTDISYLSPDIWAEDMDGNVVENLVSGETYYICTRIRNRGTIPSAGDEVLYLHWTKAVIGGVWPYSWIEGASYDCNGNYVSVGGEITPDGGFSLPSIAPNETYVARVLWQTPDNSMYLPCMEFIDNENELWHYCLLARVYDENEHPGEDMTSISMSNFVLHSNNVASKNISIMTPTDNGLSAIVALSVPYDGVFSLRGSVGPSFEGLINGDVYVSLTLSENLYHSWPFEGNGYTELGDNTIQIDLDTVLLTGLYLEENVIYSLKLDVLDNSSANNFMYDIALIDSAGFPIGGEIFKMGEENPHNYFTSPERRRTIQTEDSSNIIKCKQSPIADVVEIDSSSEIISTTLVSAFGDIVQKQNTNVVDISSLPMGVYILIVETQNNIQQFKIVKKQ